MESRCKVAFYSVDLDDSVAQVGRELFDTFRELVRARSDISVEPPEPLALGFEIRLGRKDQPFRLEGE